MCSAATKYPPPEEQGSRGCREFYWVEQKAVIDVGATPAGRGRAGGGVFLRRGFA